MSESKEDDINNTMEPIVNSWDDTEQTNIWDCIPEELSPDEPHSCNLRRDDTEQTNIWDDCIPEELFPDEPCSGNLCRYDSDVQLINLKQFTSLTRNFINAIFREEQCADPEDFTHIYEDISHDGYDADGPCSNLIDLFITIYRYDRYYYFFYQAEEWHRPNEVVEYKLTDSFTSNCYDPIIYNQTDWWRARDELK